MAIWSPEVEVPAGINVNNFPATQPVSGSVSVSGSVTVGNFPATQPVSGTVSVNNFPGGSVGTATVTNVSVSTASTSLASSNVNRRKLIVHNESGTLFLKLGTAASATSYTYRLTANTVAEITGYYGDVHAIKASGTSAVLVTDL